MKSILAIAALVVAGPALAITVNGASVNSAATVLVNGIPALDNDSAGVTGFLPAALTTGSSAQLIDGAVPIAAFSSVAASWASATEGSVTINWGWDARTTSGSDVFVNTITPGNNNWAYSFTTGTAPGVFSANWALDVTAENSFGLQGIFGGGSLPFFITPPLTSPVDAAFSFSQPLAANTSYMLTIYNFGNTGGGADRFGSADFTMDWTITGGGNAVPEPASWAMLITGFGLVGAGLRRRRANA